MTTGEIAKKEWDNAYSLKNREEAWQAAADAVTQHEREAVVRWMRSVRFNSEVMAEKIERGEHHALPPKTPGQVAYEACYPRARKGEEAWERVRDQEAWERAAQAVIDHHTRGSSSGAAGPER